MSDLIKREDAIEVLAINAPFMSDEAYLKSYDALNAIPSVEPFGKDINVRSKVEPKKSEWIDIGGYEVCKNCHEVKEFPHWNFCPNCGAMMKGADDE